MKLTILSDTHGFHRGMGLHGNPPLPEADVLIHCGDYSRDHGSQEDTLRFARWMQTQSYKHKVSCPGNHEQWTSKNPTKAAEIFQDHGVHMLGMDPVDLDGIVFDGGPWMPVSGQDPAWGFEVSDIEREKQWGRIGRCNVLVTHTPPMGILDQSNSGPRIGCPVLRKHVFERIRPRLHCFGHVHEARGLVQEEGIWFMNASSNTRGTYTRDESATVTNMSMGIRDPFTFNLKI